MPYAKDLNNGEMIYHPVTGTAMHIEVFSTVKATTAGAAPGTLIIGHSPIHGRPMTAEPSSALPVTECLTDYSVVNYHGSLTDHHGTAFVFESCPCDSCRKSPEEHYVLWHKETGQEMLHVRRASFTVATVHCAHCYAQRCAAERQLTA